MQVMKGMTESWKHLDAAEKAKFCTNGQSMTHMFITRCYPEHLRYVAQDFSEHQRKFIDELGLVLSNIINLVG